MLLANVGERETEVPEDAVKAVSKGVHWAKKVNVLPLSVKSHLEMSGISSPLAVHFPSPKLVTHPSKLWPTFLGLCEGFSRF